MLIILFLRAVAMFPFEGKNNCECWFVGGCVAEVVGRAALAGKRTNVRPASPRAYAQPHCDQLLQPA